MAGFQIVEAVADGGLMKVSLHGPSKYGKSLNSHLIARGAIQYLGPRGLLYGNGKVAVIDTENKSSKKYAVPRGGQPSEDRFLFDVIYFDGPFTPEGYIERIKAFHEYSFIIIDQITEEWAGTEGTLQRHAKITKESKSQNGYIAWQGVTPPHDAFLFEIKNCPNHVIAIMRSKVKHKIVKQTGEIVKLGVKPIARDTTDYEFDVNGVVVKEGDKHGVHWEGAREGLNKVLVGTTYWNPRENLGRILAEKIVLGIIETEAEYGDLAEHLVTEINSLLKQAGFSQSEVIESLAAYGVNNVRKLTPKNANEVIRNIKSFLSQRKLQEKADAKKHQQVEESTDNYEVNIPAHVPPSKPKPAKKELTLPEVQEAVMAEFNKSVAEYPTTEEIDDEAVLKTEAEWHELREQTSELAEAAGYDEEVWNNHVAEIAESTTVTADDFTVEQLQRLCQEITATREQNAANDAAANEDTRWGQLREQASDLAEEVGYDKTMWDRHIAHICKPETLTADEFNIGQLEQLVHDLGTIKADKDANPDKFDITEWSPED